MGQYIADEIRHCSHNQLDIRVSVLGHIQRGGIPSAGDRLLASAFGKAAVDLIAPGRYCKNGGLAKRRSCSGSFRKGYS